MIEAVAEAIGQCAAESPWRIAAASIEATHLHLLITYSGLDIDRTVKWLAQKMTKRVHSQTAHRGPVFCEGRWREFIFDARHRANVCRYIERHNERRGESSRPYSFISAEEIRS